MVESSIDKIRGKHSSNRLQKVHKATRLTMLIIGGIFSFIFILGILLLVLYTINDDGNPGFDLEAALAFVTFIATLIVGFLGAVFLGMSAIALKWPHCAGIALYVVSGLFIFFSIVALFGYGASLSLLEILWSIAAFFAIIGTINITFWRVSRNSLDNSLITGNNK